MKQINKNSLTVMFFISLIFSIFSTGCDKLIGILGNGNVITEERDASDFHKISVGDAFEVILLQDSIESLTIESDENLMEIIKTKVINGKLKIYTSNPILKATRLKAIIHFIDINLLELSGAVDAVGMNIFEMDNIDIALSGASDIEIALNTNSIDINLSGASSIDIELYTNITSMDLSGASKIFIVGETDEADYTFSGASNYSGFGFIANTMELNISGASHANVNVIETLIVDASGASEVIYKGDPELFLDLSGSSTVKPF